MNMKNFYRNFEKYNQPKPLMAILISIALITLPLNALPIGAQRAAGSVQISQNAKNMLIKASNRAIINYKSFNIGLREGVRFIQPSSSSVVLNRVIQANPSSILGTLNANGRVFLVNPAGIFFGANSVVNANSFIATTLNIKDSDFLSGNYAFNQMKDRANSYIVQKGKINISDNGFVVLASPLVSSEGSIIAKSGHIVIGATDNYYMQFDPSGLIKYDYKPMTNNDKPIVMPNDMANNIVNNIINTDSIENALKIVKNGNKIELQGASGSAFISSKLNTDATNQKQAGKIEVKAQKNAFILNGANFQSNAKENGNGGYISVFSHNLTYSDKGASYTAKGGSISGNGGFAEVSAKNKVIFDGSKIDLFGKGKKGTFLIDPNILDITSDITLSNTNYTALASSSITLDNGVSITTNGGNIDFSAPSIFLLDNSKLDAGSGDISLSATMVKNDIFTPAISNIVIHKATLTGNKIDITSTATSTNHYDNLNGTSIAIDQALTFLANSPISPAGVSITNADSSVDIKNGASITGNSVNINSVATTDGNVLTVFAGAAVGYGKSTASAVTTIENGASVTANGGNIDIKSHATTDNKVKAYTINLGGSRGTKANVTLSYAKSTTTSKSEVQNGASITANSGNVNIEATSDKTIQSSALAGAYADGTLGAAVSISESTTSTDAIAGGVIGANNLNVKATTNNNLVKSSASAAVGNGLVAKIAVKVANNILDKLSKYTNLIPSAQSGSSTTPYAISAAFAYGDHSTNTNAYIADGASITTSNQLSIEALTSYPIDVANGAKGIKSSAIATVDSNKENVKENSVAGALLYTNINNNTRAYIGKNTVVESDGDIYIHSKTYVPYEIIWNQIGGVSDITDKLNSNLGIQNGFFTTWAQSNSEGKVVGAAGSVNIFHMKNNTNSYIDNNAKINQTTQNFANLTLLSQTDLQSLNLSGVFGLKGIGAGGGKGSVGGSYLDVLYDDTTTSSIKSGAKTKSKTLSLKSDSATKNISIAEAGGSAGKFGVAGSASYLRINNKTYTSIDGATIVLDDPTNSSYHDILKLKSIDDATIYNITGGITKASNVGVGVSVSINNISRDTYAKITGSTIDSYISSGDNYLEAYNTGLIGAYSLAGAVNAPPAEEAPTGSSGSAPDGGGGFGVGISGDASLNNISDNAEASIKDSVFNANTNNLTLNANNDNEIDSFTGSVTIGTSSVGLSGSYSQNNLGNSAKSFIDNSALNTNKLTMDATNTGSINSISASGSFAWVSVLALAGSVSINDIQNDTLSYITNSSDVTANSDVLLSSDDTPSIKSIAGAAVLGGSVGIGASFAKNDIKDNTQAYFSRSDVISQGSISLLSNMISDIKLYSATLSAALEGMAAAISVAINDIESSVNSYISGKKSNGINSDGDLNVKALDNSNIEANSGSGALASFGGLGASVLINTIKNTLLSYFENTDASSGGNSKIIASSDKSIKTVSVGGSGAGTATLAGSVVVNTVGDTINSYILNSVFNVNKSLSIKALETNDITAWGGSGTIAGVFGVGGTAVANNLANSIEAYISNSTVNAKGNGDALSVLKSDTSGDNEVVNGLDILSLAKENIQIRTATLAGGGSGAIVGSVAVNLIKDNLSSYVANSSNINGSNTGASNLQDIRVRSLLLDDIDSAIGGLAVGGGAAFGGSVVVTTLKNKNKSYIDGSTLYANGKIQARSDSFKWINNVVVGGSFSVGASLQGSVSVVNVDDIVESYFNNTKTYSNGFIDILANDTTKLGTKKDGTKIGIITGGVSGSAVVGIGGSVTVNKINQNVKAHADNSILNAKKSTNIITNANADLLNYSGTISLGGSAGIAGSVVVNNIDVTSQAYTLKTGSNTMSVNQDSNYKTAEQDVNIVANSDSKTDSTLGSLGAGFAGISGSVEVITIKNTLLAQVGSGTSLNAGRDLSVKTQSLKAGKSKVVAFGGGAGAVSGAVSVMNINNAIDSDSLSASKNTNSYTDGKTNNNIVAGRLGSTDGSVFDETKTNVDDSFATTQPTSTIYADIQGNSNINVDETSNINSIDHISLDTVAGAAAGGVVGIGGGVAVANINSDTRAFVGPYTNINSKNLDISSEFKTTTAKVRGYAGSVGVIGLGAAVSILNLKGYKNYSFIDNNTHVTAIGDIVIQAATDLPSSSKAYGASIGGAAVGVVISKTLQNGETKAFGGNSLDLKANNINVGANYNTDIDTYSQASSGGILSGSGSDSTATAKPTVVVAFGDGSLINATSDINIKSFTNGNVESKSDGNSYGGISVGVSTSDTTWKPNITSYIGNNNIINATNFTLLAFENFDTDFNALSGNRVMATSNAATGSLLGAGNGATATSLSDATLLIYIGDSSTINTSGNINLNTKAYAKADSSGDGTAYSGFLSAGNIKATATNNADVQSNINSNAKLISANGDISILAYSRNEAFATTTGGTAALLGGIGINTASSVINNNVKINIGNVAELEAKNGDIKLHAIGNINTKSKAHFETDGIISVNESTAEVEITQGIGVEIKNNAKLTANNIDILSQVEKLKAIADSLSNTEVAASTNSKAHSTVGVTSTTNIHVNPYASLVGYNSVKLRSLQDNFYTESTAKARINAGFTGSLEGRATNNLNINSYITVDKNSKISSNDIYMESYSPSSKSNEIYVKNADVEAHTVINWVLTTVDVLVKKISNIPIIGWFLKWVWKKAKKWVEHILNSVTSATTPGSTNYNSKITVQGDMYQIPQGLQKVEVASDGSITNQGDASANIVGNNVVVNDLINHQVGKITLKSSDKIEGTGTIHVSNAYPEVDIINYSNKNLVLNRINTISDNANDPNLQIFAAKDTTNFGVVAQTLTHNVNIQNTGNSDIFFKGDINNYGGEMSVFNKGGDILSLNNPIIKTQSLSLQAPRGSIGTLADRVNVELQQSSLTNFPSITSTSLGKTYLGIRMSEFSDTRPVANQVLYSSLLNDITANDYIDLALYQGYAYWNSVNTVTNSDGSSHDEITSHISNVDTNYEIHKLCCHKQWQ